MTPSISSWLSLFSPSHQQKPRFMALAAAVLAQTNDILSLIQTGFPEAFALDTAAGVQLDALGMLLNTPRPSSAVSDEDYRFLLRARIAAFHWDGTNETVSRMLAMAFPGRTASMTDNMDGTVNVSLSGDAPFPLKGLFPHPAGVKLIEV